MYRYVRLIPVIALFAAPLGPAHALEILDRVVGFAEDAFKATQRAPDGPPPLRVGLMLPQSGQMREAGERIARGWQIALQMSDGYVALRPVDLVFGDISVGPDAAVVEAEAMSETTPIDVYAGVLGARTSFNIGAYQSASDRFIAGKTPTITTLGPDSRGGHRIIRRFVRAYRNAGGRIIDQLWIPPERKYDWSSMLARSSLHGPQSVYVFFEGRNAENIVHQYSRNGLNRTVGLIGPESLFDPRVMNRRGKHADGLRFLSSFLPDLDAPGNRTFVEAYRKKYFEDPDSYAYMGYENALAVLLTAADLDGQIHVGAAFVETMKNVAYEYLMPRGEYGLNESNSAYLTRLFWVEVVYRDGKTKMKRLGSIPIDPDTMARKRQTAAHVR